MSAFLLFAYTNEEAAGRVLARLRASGTDGGDLDSSSVVRVAVDGKFTVTTTDRPGRGSPFWGILWEALFGLVFLVPAAGTSYGPNLGGLFGAIDRAGIDEDARARIREALGPGSSALGLLLRETRPELVTQLIQAHGGTKVEASISLEEDSELAQELGAIVA
ncbi:MAG: DUF1269 domain-containing protein [Solirubrobacterales bacterium]|nr:DUF1269 domain-containing protein [Solirubrobacterales bacterium]MBV9918121.1 DUF1269 domain-containing protein [Solirubrobacterales bacterium]